MEIQDVVSENLRKQLAVAVRSIQWSYAIFWSISASASASSSQPGVLEWGDGYYNGDIKTRKTVQSAELNADHLGLQRSEQLRELYESLSGAEANPEAKRPSASLSPEDLTDTEWYYLVCMSFVFSIGQGLPGRTLAKNQIIWLCNAHQADSKVFSRSLLAKSASIQTVVCFPHLGGVIELGVTDVLLEDKDLVQHIKSAFLDNPYPIISDIPYYPPGDNGRDDQNMIEADHLDLLNEFEEDEEEEEGKISSNNNGTSVSEDVEESHMQEGLNGEAPEKWKFKDEEINSSDCVSQTYQELHDCKQNSNSFGFRGDEIHYQGVLSTLLKSSHQLVLGPYFRNVNKESSFVCWKKEIPQTTTKNRGRKHQRVLKKILFEVPRMHGNFAPQSSKENGNKRSICRPEADGVENDRVLAERKRRQRLNERFSMLESLVPTNDNKVDKITLLDDTIEYLKELERRVKELESQNVAMVEKEGRTAKRNQEANYFRKRMIGKRKAREDADVEGDDESDECGSSDLTVSVIDRNALIELKCPWMESVLLDVLEGLTNLNLDSHTIQSSNNDGILSATIKAKFKGAKVASASMIRQAIQKIMRKNRTSQ